MEQKLQYRQRDAVCVRHITVENFGSVDVFDAKLTPQLNLLESRFSHQLAAALDFLLCRPGGKEISSLWVREDTRVFAEICLADATFLVGGTPTEGRLQLRATDPTGADATKRYQYALSHTREQDDAEVFDGQDPSAPLRLYRYYQREDRKALSGRLADTKTFRSYLHHYIQNFQPEPLRDQKAYRVTVDPSGRFRVRHPKIPGEGNLSETERKLFRYICFLNTAEFWTNFEKIRDLHHGKKPLLIRNFAEFLDESVEVGELIKRTKKLQRQILLLTEPLTEETRKKWRGE